MLYSSCPKGHDDQLMRKEGIALHAISCELLLHTLRYTDYLNVITFFSYIAPVNFMLQKQFNYEYYNGYTEELQSNQFDLEAIIWRGEGELFYHGECVVTEEDGQNSL